MGLPLDKTLRDQTIDIAKGIGIILVVIGHNSLVVESRSTVFELIFSFHMPLFFVLAGVYLSQNRALKPFLFSKFDSLVKTYFSFFLLFWLVLAAAGGLNSWGYWAGIAYAASSTIPPAAIPAWFLPSLFISICTAYCLIISVKKSIHCDKYLMLIATSLMVAGIVNIKMFWIPGEFDWVIPSYLFGKKVFIKGLPWSLDLLPITCALVIFGWLAKDLIRNLKFQWIPFISALIIFGALHKYFHYTIDLAARRFDDVGICLAQILIGIYLVLAFSSKIRFTPILSPVLAYLGQVSLVILLFHMPIRNALARALSHTPLSFTFSAIVASILCLLASIAVFELIIRVKLIGKMLLPTTYMKSEKIKIGTGVLS